MKPLGMFSRGYVPSPNRHSHSLYSASHTQFIFEAIVAVIEKGRRATVKEEGKNLLLPGLAGVYQLDR
jgi:hypothetical protein